MTREVIRVEPLSTYLERVKAPACVATRHNDTVYVSGLPPFDPTTGNVVVDATVERQAELVLEQLKLCVETAGLLARPGAQVQCLLHLGGKVRCC